MEWIISIPLILPFHGHLTLLSLQHIWRPGTMIKQSICLQDFFPFELLVWERGTMRSVNQFQVHKNVSSGCFQACACELELVIDNWSFRYW
ncbi:hypothetical protein M758_2G140700 [Ceratodon purpureus]|nr:hypothetical protein M758_2G140700 [Ceratodon purpureus]